MINWADELRMVLSLAGMNLKEESMAGEYLCTRIVLGRWDERYGSQALCKVAEEISDHKTSVTGRVVPKGHRLLTSPVAKVEITSDQIAVFTESGSKYWMRNDEGAEPKTLSEPNDIKMWLLGRGPEPDPVPIMLIDIGSMN